MNSLQLQSEVTTATPRGRSGCVDFRARSPQRHPEVARVVSIPERGHYSDTRGRSGCVDLRATNKPGATSHIDYLRSLPTPRATCRGRCTSIIWSNL
ncbi:hypothetical protein F2Q68_00040715 [Brassica cretica]|uniref:Neprosin activation peptide domain-containing protein n=2 Tax=Brassica cretica TaxID=69181 RepID=A0ABQ7A6X1_BRACR|nr:hypothetical protein F2Q68_00040715 [Brassica cretica]KAF3493417.1 hypothetical protein DY000_02054813 [Brassica cretica]